MLVKRNINDIYVNHIINVTQNFGSFCCAFTCYSLNPYTNAYTISFDRNMNNLITTLIPTRS